MRAGDTPTQFYRPKNAPAMAAKKGEYGQLANMLLHRPTAFVQPQCRSCCCCCNQDCCCAQTATTTTAMAGATAKAADKQFAGLWHGQRRGEMGDSKGGRFEPTAGRGMLSCIWFMNSVLTASVQPENAQAIPQPSRASAIRSNPSEPNNSLAHFSINFAHLNILFAIVFVFRIILLLLLSSADAH